MANNLFVQGQMWGFRRWLIQKVFTLEEYTDYQFALIKSHMTYRTDHKKEE